MSKLKIGIFFGGPSRERDLSLAIAQQFYQQLDLTLFEAAFIFVDIHQNLFEVPFETFSRDSIQDFFSDLELVKTQEYRIHQESLAFFTELEQAIIWQNIGKTTTLSELSRQINLAFVDLGKAALERPLLQQIIDLGIPFIGPSLATRSLMDGYLHLAHALKENRILSAPALKWQLPKEGFPTTTIESFQKEYAGNIISPTEQRGLYARTIFTEAPSPTALQEAFANAQFQLDLDLADWDQLPKQEQHLFLQSLVSIQHGLGFPIQVQQEDQLIEFYHPKALETFLEHYSGQGNSSTLLLRSNLTKTDILVEPLIKGHLFHCIVLQDGQDFTLALHPVFEEHKNKTRFSQLQLDLIRRKCITAAKSIHLKSTVAIQGIFTSDDEIYIKAVQSIYSPDLQDCLARQLQILGWNHQQWSKFLIKAALHQNQQSYPEKLTFKALTEHLNTQFEAQQQEADSLPTIAILLSSRPVSNKATLAAHYAYEQMKTLGGYKVNAYGFHQKDQVHFIPASDWEIILEKGLDHWLKQKENISPIVQEISYKAAQLQNTATLSAIKNKPPFLLEEFSADWILPYFDDINSYQLCFEKLNPNRISFGKSADLIATFGNSQSRILAALNKNNIHTIEHFHFSQKDFIEDRHGLIKKVEQKLYYPIGAIDDQHPQQRPFLINNQQELLAYAQLRFRPKGSVAKQARRILGLNNDQPIPPVSAFLLKPGLRQISPAFILTRSTIYVDANSTEGSIDIFGHSQIDQQDSSRNQLLELPESVKLQLNHQLERLARLLKVQSYATIDSYLRIFEHDKIELLISTVDTLPLFTPEHVIFAQLKNQGLLPVDLFKHIITSELPSSKTTVAPMMLNEEEINPSETEQNEPTDSNVDSSTQEPTIVASTDAPELNQGEKKASFFKRAWQETISFLRAPIFLKNLGAIFGLALVLFFLTTTILSWYTLEGKSIIVEDLTEQSYEEAQKEARSQKLRVAIGGVIPSTDGDQIPREVIRQEPQAGTKVKKNRTLYLWIRGEREEVSLPQLAGKDYFEAYKRDLENRGIALVITERKYDRKLQEETILSFDYNGKTISLDEVSSGVKIPKGTQLGVVVSTRLKNSVQIPNFVCMTFEEAKFQIDASRLKLGEVQGTRNNSSYVWKQEPVYIVGQEIKTNSSIKLYLSSEFPADCGDSEE